LPPAHQITVLQTIHLIDERFSSTLEALAAGNFVFWVGSGISRDKFPMLDGLIIKVLEFLRYRIDMTTKNCPYHHALTEAFDLAGLDAIRKGNIDLSQPATNWPDSTLLQLTTQLSVRYSDFLSIRIGDEDNDFLVREGIDVISTYADPSTSPDAEHICLAALLLEGVVTDIATANWDGLIEAAYSALAGGDDGLAVCVTSQQLQDQGTKPKLIKFHGCAISAKNDPANFLELIIARSAQLSDWGSGAKTAAIKSYLKGVISQKRTLMLGLSAQDFNIQYLFREARDILSWTWTSDAPAYVFSEDQLGAKQSDLLENVYRDQYDGAQRAVIENHSVIRAFAKSLLLALLLQVYTEKLTRIANRAENLGTDAAKEWVARGIRSVRDCIASEEPTDKAEKAAFATVILNSVSRIVRLITTGRPGHQDDLYRPVWKGTADQVALDPALEGSGLPEAAVALSILGQGHQKSAWKISHGDSFTRSCACAVIEKPGTRTPVYMAATANAAHWLFSNGVIDEQTEAILIHSEGIPERLQRNPQRTNIWRSGNPSLQEVSVKDLLTHDSASDQLFRRFREETAL